MDRQYTTTPAFSTADLLQRTGQMQLDFGGQMRESILGGALDSFGLGTVAREVAIPQGNMSLEAFARDNPLQAGIDAAKAVGGLFQPPKPPLSQEEYQQGPFFRKDIPWDPRMTEDRAAALAAWYDAKQVRDQRLAQTDGWAVKLFGNMLGQALDPINYIPFLGAAAKTAAVTRLGVVGGHIAAASADAAINTAIFGAATARERQGFGDDVSFQSLLLDTASAAAIGAVFGSIGGIGEARGIRQRGVALREITETHAALDDAVGSFLTEGEVRIRPETVDGLARIAERENPSGRRDLFADLRSRAFGETAVGRFIDTRPVRTGEFEDFMRQAVFRENPELEARYYAAETDFRAAQDRVAGIEEPLAARGDADTLALVDPASADRLRAIDDELTKKPNAKRRAALDAERQSVLSSFAPEQLAKAESDFRIGPQKAAKNARKSLAEARQAFGKVRRETDALAQQHLDRNRALYSPKLDTRTPPPAAPVPELAAAQQAVGKSIKDAKALAEDFGVDYESGDFPEAEDFAQLEQQGRLSAEDKQAVDDATEIFQRAKVYADALEQAAICGMN